MVYKLSVKRDIMQIGPAQFPILFFGADIWLIGFFMGLPHLGKFQGRANLNRFNQKCHAKKKTFASE